ncbi:hypothetical protein K3177_14760 [Qipengyuania sp. GH25]|uniref:Uncharacterized protein n=1 Tax=Qipengyuania pacifica TaxID=2860199 RepID=A0ABS7JK49_9SPHN|nr:hypothetical protein [Qipengyuania aerophila]MBX7489767.1 hypothetical protein [Qipengyuania aerophila]
MTVILNKTQWLARVSVIAQIKTPASELDHHILRDRLAECDAVMRAAPFNLRNDFGEFREDDLQKAARQHASAIEAKGIHWPRPRYARVHAHFDLAVHIRAIDELLRDYDLRNHAVTRNPKRWKDSAGMTYVIPTRRPRPLDARAGDGFRAGYNKRGTIRHRVVPAEVDGLPVKVVISGKLGMSRAHRPIQGGGAVFPGLELDCEKKNQRFIVTGIRCGDVARTIRDQISALTDCHLLVWPELTIDDDALKAMSKSLKGASRSSVQARSMRKRTMRSWPARASRTCV